MSPKDTYSARKANRTAAGVFPQLQKRLKTNGPHVRQKWKRVEGQKKYRSGKTIQPEISIAIFECYTLSPNPTNMEIANESVVEELNKLLQRCYESKRSYLTASEHMHVSILSKLCTDIAEQRSKFAGELLDEVIKYCGVPVSEDSVAEKVKHAWENLSDLLRKKDEKAMLDACRSADEATMAEYEVALTESLPLLIKSILMKHHESIRLALTRVKMLQKTVDDPRLGSH